MGIVKSNKNQTVYNQPQQKDNYVETDFELDGSASQYLAVPTTARGFLVYQISDTYSELSGVLTINLEMSNDGVNWLQATDANGEDITHSLSVDSTVMEKLSDINLFVKLRLSFASAVTGTIVVSTRV